MYVQLTSRNSSLSLSSPSVLPRVGRYLASAPSNCPLLLQKLDNTNTNIIMVLMFMFDIVNVKEVQYVYALIFYNLYFLYFILKSIN